MKKKLFILMLLNSYLLNAYTINAYALNTSASSSAILFLGENTEPERLKGYSYAHPEDITFIDWFKKHHTPRTKSKFILNLFADAQSSFIEEDTTVASQKFKKILPYIYTEDWSTEEKELFVLTRMRLAQLEPEQSQENIRSAYLLYPDFQLPLDLFAPDLVQRWNEFKKNSNLISIKLNAWKDYELILIDGKEYSLVDTNYEIKMTMGYHRFTFLSNKYAPETYNITTDKLAQLKAKHEALVYGDCLDSKIAKTSLAQKLNPNAVKVIYPDCTFDPTQSATKTPMTLSELTAQEPISATDNLVWNQENPKEKSSLYEKKSFWWGLFGAGTVYMLIKSNSDKEKEPTTSSGW